MCDFQNQLSYVSISAFLLYNDLYMSLFFNSILFFDWQNIGGGGQLPFCYTMIYLCRYFSTLFFFGWQNIRGGWQLHPLPPCSYGHDEIFYIFYTFMTDHHSIDRNYFRPKPR